MLQYAAVCCSMLQYVAVCRLKCRVKRVKTISTEPQEYVAVCCSMLQYGAVCCNMLQYVAVCCSIDSSVVSKESRQSLQSLKGMLQCVAVCSSMVQYVAVCCSMLQYVDSVTGLETTYCNLTTVSRVLYLGFSIFDFSEESARH